MDFSVFINFISSYRFKQVLSWHRIRSRVCTTLRSISEYYLGERYVRSLIRYSLNRESHSFFFGFSLNYSWYYVFLLFQTNLTVSQDQNNCLQNIKEEWWVCLEAFYVRSWGRYGLKWGIRWLFYFLFIELCLPNVSYKYYHYTGSNEMYSKYKVLRMFFLVKCCVPSLIIYGPK